MTAPSIDYEALLDVVGSAPDPTVLGDALLDALADRYLRQHGEAGLMQMLQEGATYLFDLAQAADLERSDRTVAAWALFPAAVQRRDENYQRRFPMQPSAKDRPQVDRGHLIPHVNGGLFGPNIFRQDRALNQGRSEQGKRYRALEREAAAVVGTFFFGHLLYEDDTDYPVEVEIGLLRAGVLHVERFDNRPSEAGWQVR